MLAPQLNLPQRQVMVKAVIDHSLTSDYTMDVPASLQVCKCLTYNVLSVGLHLLYYESSHAISHTIRRCTLLRPANGEEHVHCT